VPDYVGSARRDPDGSAIRLSLQRRVTVNTMTAGTHYTLLYRALRHIREGIVSH